MRFDSANFAKLHHHLKSGLSKKELVADFSLCLESNLQLSRRSFHWTTRQLFHGIFLVTGDLLTFARQCFKHDGREQLENFSLMAVIQFDAELKTILMPLNGFKLAD